MKNACLILYMLLISFSGYAQINRVKQSIPDIRFNLNDSTSNNYSIMLCKRWDYSFDQRVDFRDYRNLWKNNRQNSGTGFGVGALAGSILGLTTAILCSQTDLNNGNSIGNASNMSAMGAGVLGGFYGILIGSEMGWEIEEYMILGNEGIKFENDLEMYWYFDK